MVLDWRPRQSEAACAGAGGFFIGLCLLCLNLQLPMVVVAAGLDVPISTLLAAASASSVMLTLAAMVWRAMCRRGDANLRNERRVRLDLDQRTLVCEEREGADAEETIRQSTLPLERLALLCSREQGPTGSVIWRLELCLPIWVADQDRPVGYPLREQACIESADASGASHRAQARQLAEGLCVPLFDDAAACCALLERALRKGDPNCGGEAASSPRRLRTPAEHHNSRRNHPWP